MTAQSKWRPRANFKLIQYVASRVQLLGAHGPDMQWQWCKNHSSNVHNDEADDLVDAGVAEIEFHGNEEWFLLANLQSLESIEGMSLYDDEPDLHNLTGSIGH